MITMQALRIDTRSSEPSYRQLARQLRDAITSGEIEPGELLPSQNRIKQETGLAPGTIQRAIGVLVDEGIAYTVPGRGTFAGQRPELSRPPRPRPRAHHDQDVSGCILYRPDRARGIPLASRAMEEDDEPGRIPLRNSEFRYIQVAADLEARIRSGEFAYDSRLPRREDLASEYGVGEMTVRRALGVLAARGLVRPMPSVGTVVIWAGHGQGTS